MKKRIFSLLSAAVIAMMTFNSCSDDNDSDKEIPLDYRMIVLSEGTYGKATAEVAVIGRDNVVKNNVFNTVNDRPLGDVAQSCTLINGKLYITLNNSAKIEVVNAKDFKQIETILDDKKEKKPQYVVQISKTEALVSDLGNKISIINTESDSWKETIDIEASSSRLLKVGNKVLINTKKIYVFDIATKKIEKKVDVVPIDKAAMVKDNTGNIWVLTETALVQLDGVTFDIKKEIKFENVNYSINMYASRLDISKDGKTLFFNAGSPGGWVANTLYSVETTATKAPTESLSILGDNVTTLYNFAVSPEGTIIVCDALDYKQSGKIFEFNLKGEKLNEWIGGVIPQYIFFSDKN